MPAFTLSSLSPLKELNSQSSSVVQGYIIIIIIIIFLIVSGCAQCVQAPRLWALNEVSVGGLHQGIFK
jgi:hypothetical protein